MVKVKKALFVNPRPTVSKVIMEASHYPPMGIAYTAAYLESKEIECKIIDADILGLENEEVFKQIREFNPDLVGITFNVAKVEEAMNISSWIKENLNKVVILGGPSASGDVRNILEKSKADCIVRNEGEIVTWNIVQSECNFKNVNGIVFLDNGNMVITPEQEPIMDLDSLPMPAYHLLPDLKYYKTRARRTPVVPMVTERGCPYGCVFCNSARTGFRPRSPENVVKEIEVLVNKYKVKQIDILDDNFTFNLDRAHKILDLIIDKKIKILITFPNGLRADRLTEELVAKMAKAGVYRTGIGIESGEQKIVDGIKKSLDLEKVRLAMKWLRKYGIISFGYFQFGLPGETRETMAKTIEFAKEINPNWANFGVTTPLPGTFLYKNLKETGKLNTSEDKNVSTGFYSIKKGYGDTETLKMDDVLDYQRKAWMQFYFRPGKVFDVLGTIRSFGELRWTASIAWPILKGIFNKGN